QLRLAGGDLLQGLDLREHRGLLHHRGRVGGLHRVLVAQLRDEQLQERLGVHAAERRRRRGRGTGRRGGGHVTDHVSLLSWICTAAVTAASLWSWGWGAASGRDAAAAPGCPPRRRGGPARRSRRRPA